MSPKKIAFLCSSRSWGGLEMNVFRLQKWLCEQSLSVVLLAQENSRLYKETLKNQLSVVPIPSHRKYFDLYKAWCLAKMLQKEQIQVLFIFHSSDMDLAAWVKRLFLPNLIVIYQQHMQISTNKKDILHTFRYKMYDAWICPSEFLAEQVQRYTNFPPEKISIIPLGVEIQPFVNNTLSQEEALRFFNVPYDKDFTYLGIIGRIDVQKGQLFVIKALKTLLQENYRLKLLIVGDKTYGESERYFQEIQLFITNHQLADFVYLRPFTSHVETFYRAIDVFILSSLAETYGMVTIEAMLSGKIILATNSGGTPSILGGGEYGVLFQPENEEDFIAKLKSILSAKEVFLEKAQCGRKHAASYYSHLNECQQLVELLTSLFHKKNLEF